jgi:D-xylose transport system substrate-binding protein
LRNTVCLLVAMFTLAGLISGCTSGSGTRQKTPKVGVILPDTTSSTRWETEDRRYLENSFQSAGIKYDIKNAGGDRAAFMSIADQMLNSGATVLMITSLDSESGTQVIKKAEAKGVKVIDYDRLTTGGGASYYVSFDNVAVGQLQGQGLVKCLAATNVKNPVVAELHGSPTDNNATQFKQGYDGVLGPKYQSKAMVKGPDKPVKDWNNDIAKTVFEQMMAETAGRIDGVLAANDGLANSVISVLKTKGMAGKVPVTGQDATVPGLQHILAGEQCMTVYKAVRQEATAAALLAVSLATGSDIHAGQLARDPVTGHGVQANLLTPVAITKENIKTVIDDGFVTHDELCTADFAAACKAAGL